jgi:hypothetical protein
MKNQPRLLRATKFSVLSGAAAGLLLAACGGTPPEDGEDGINALMAVTEEAPGENCPQGGHRVDFGGDVNVDGILDADEIEGTN